MTTPDISDLFTNPATIAAVAAIAAYLIPLALRQWVQIPAAPVALFVAALVFLGGRMLSAEQQSMIISLLGILFATLAAMGISLRVEKFMLGRQVADLAASAAPDTEDRAAAPWYRSF